MIVLPLLAALIGLAWAGNVPEELAKQVMEQNLLQDCWGEGNMAGYHKRVKDAADKCQLMTSTVTVADLFDLFEPVSVLFGAHFLFLTGQQRPMAST